MCLLHLIRVYPLTSYACVATIEGKLVINDIIPAVAMMRERYRISFSAIYGKPFSNREAAPEAVEIGDLDHSDAFFNSIVKEWVCFR